MGRSGKNKKIAANHHSTRKSILEDDVRIKDLDDNKEAEIHAEVLSFKEEKKENQEKDREDARFKKLQYDIQKEIDETNLYHENLIKFPEERKLEEDEIEAALFFLTDDNMAPEDELAKIMPVIEIIKGGALSKLNSDQLNYLEKLIPDMTTESYPGQGVDSETEQFIDKLQAEIESRKNS